MEHRTHNKKIVSSISYFVFCETNSFFFRKKKQNTKHKIQNTSSGLTLVELLVAVAIFSIIMIIAMGGVISILAAYKKTQSIQSAMTNLNFALETMTRDIRFGTDYVCPGSSCDSIEVTFRENDQDKQIEFYLIESGDDAGTLMKSVDNSDQKLTADLDDVEITDLTFYPVGNGANDGQPRITIVVTGIAGQGQTASEFTLQTTVSQRLLDQS